MEQQLISIDAGPVQLEGMLGLPDDPIGVVLFAHGSGSSRFSSRNNQVARQLRQARIGTLLLDLLSAQEEQDGQHGQARFDIALLTQRLGKASDWLAQHAATRHLALGLFGASTGAAAALRLAAAEGAQVAQGQQAARIAAVVSRGGRADMAGVPALQSVRAPTLLIVGALDEVVLELNLDAYAHLQCDKRLEIVPGASHLFEEPGALQTVALLACDWFVQHFATSVSGARLNRGPASRE
jgi:putative phosphoribosyl transferase